MVSLKIDFRKRDFVWLGLVVVLLGVGVVFAYNSDMGVGTPSVMGHSAGELEGVCLSDGTGCTIPSPDYDSGWFNIANSESKILIHNLGGDIDNYVVDLQCRNANGPHNWFSGFYEGDAYGSQGVAWSKLTTTQIQVLRSSGDDYCATARVRIWAHK